MPRNTQGGSGHKSQKNSEGNKARNNRLKGDALIEDILDEVSTEGILVGKVTRRLGCGRMEIAYFNDKGEAFLLQLSSILDRWSHSSPHALYFGDYHYICC